MKQGYWSQTRLPKHRNENPNHRSVRAKAVLFHYLLTPPMQQASVEEETGPGVKTIAKTLRKKLTSAQCARGNTQPALVSTPFLAMESVSTSGARQVPEMLRGILRRQLATRVRMLTTSRKALVHPIELVVLAGPRGSALAEAVMGGAIPKPVSMRQIGGTEGASKAMLLAQRATPKGQSLPGPPHGILHRQAWLIAMWHSAVPGAALLLVSLPRAEAQAA